MEKDTVTISLKTYENMKDELELLRKQVQEKTIIKHEPHTIVFLLLIHLVIWIYVVFGH